MAAAAALDFDTSVFVFRSRTTIGDYGPAVLGYKYHDPLGNLKASGAFVLGVALFC